MLPCKPGGSSGSSHCDCKGNLREYHLPLGAELSEEHWARAKMLRQEKVSCTVRLAVGKTGPV